jgi:hypothetical protein
MKNQRNIVLILSLLVLCGCAAIRQDFGTFVPDQSAEKSFESFQIDPDMNYYFSGSDVYPSVIMGLKKQYVLDNDLWRPLKSDPKVFNDLITDMQSKASISGQLQRGFVLKSPDGQIIGVCYCTFKVRMSLKMGEGNKVVVYTPDALSYPYPADNRN